MNKARELDAALLADLQQLLGERVTTSRGVREHHGKDESYYPYAAPDAVVFARSTEEVRDIVSICRRYHTPMIPYGVGTSLEGHILANAGGVCIDMSQMNKVLAVHAEDLDATVQAGVTRKQLNEEIRHAGLMFPVDPGADATIGGMAATRASGTNAVRYGTMRENVLSLTVVTADGRIIRTSRRPRKSAAGYDLTRLFVGSEGTLGIITEVTVRLYAVPEAMSAAVCSFKDMKGAVDTVIQTLQHGIPIARSEALCGLTMKAINAYNKTNYKEQPTLWIEFHGTEAGVAEQAQLVQEIATENGGEGFEWATKPEDRTRLWSARHQAYFAGLQLRPGTRAVSTDVCVPISRLTECIIETTRDIERASMPIPLFGHVGDGNFHCMVLIRPDSDADLAEAKAFNERLVDRALSMEGTCTGEHGIGSGKIKSLKKEHGDAVDLMVAIKRTFDPDNLMNPGKVVPL
ncbi:MAG TPA: FAD-linked oxidase C-terminal domain-containing protein [Burkholderiales bacterium]|jgi:D-lactate dehydrogenase (cytochrome)|nr:FAD-linked oxidase C-terminal domain-containing protein [Burkholderiales bacterium]